MKRGDLLNTPPFIKSRHFIYTQKTDQYDIYNEDKSFRVQSIMFGTFVDF